ncbi:MAG: DUF4249 domain-containing protein [Bacteroidetes bacterium]|nr:DUF4249 domain-containing protein [Bacteroidota bacterium]
MRSIFNVLVSGILILSFVSCEKVIDIKLDEGTSQLAVDAFINNKPGTQVIKLTKTASYFNNEACPAAIGATVYITDNDSNIYNFIDNSGTGKYEWIPSVGDTLLRLAHSYTLTVNYNGEQYIATSFAFPVPLVDSLNYEFFKGNGPSSAEANYASFYSKDISGMPNFYWIKSFVNGAFLNKPSDLVVSQDGAFGGEGADGLPFILPIRQSINPEKGLVAGDTISVELHSINPETFFFFQQTMQQTQNGGLFATPPANVISNIKNINPGSTGKAVGFFNTALVASNGIKIK